MDHSLPPFDPQFTPDLTPQEMLELGVFNGYYWSPDYLDEFPASWRANAKLSDHGPDPSYNFFGVSSGQSLEEWIRKGWIHPADPLGWFQWYCRYAMGRRLPEEDARQIRRWKAFARHAAAVRKHCVVGDRSCRPRQRQALLHWAYDSRSL